MVQNSQESRRALEDFIKTFDIQKFRGEDVTKASLHIKAVAQSLGTHRLPSDIVHRILEGFARSSTPAFSNLCFHQESMVSSSLVKATLRQDTLYKTLISVLNDLERKYMELLSGQRWLGVGNNTITPTQTLHVNADASHCTDDDEYDDYVAFTIHTGRRTTPFDVWVKDKICRRCNTIGHIQRDCPTKQRSSPRTIAPSNSLRTSARTSYDKNSSRTETKRQPSSLPSTDDYVSKIKALISAARDLAGPSAHVTTAPDAVESHMNATTTPHEELSPPPVTDDYAGFLAALGCPKE